MYAQPIALADIEPGDFLAITSVKQPDGRLLAYERKKIEVPESASISTLVAGGATQLVAGAPVNLTHDANGVALRIQVGPPRK